MQINPCNKLQMVKGIHDLKKLYLTLDNTVPVLLTFEGKAFENIAE